MRLLLFNPATDADDPILGFATRWVCALAQQVEFVHVITMRAGRFEVPNNVRVSSVGKEKGYSKARRAREFYGLLFESVREERIEACFSHMIPVFTVLAAPVLKWARIPIVTWYAHPNLTWTLRLAHHLSTQVVASLPTAYPYRTDKLIVTGQGIDTDLFSPDGCLPAVDPAMILCVGRLSPVKDHPTLLKAVWLLRQHWNKPLRVVIVGAPGNPKDEAYIGSLRDMARELELEEVLEFQPPTFMESLPSWYRRCAVYVNMTPTGSGDKVVWEAMACGRPCLVANEGFKETLGEHCCRLTFRYGDAEDLARALEWVLSLSPDDRMDIGTYLRSRVIAAHSLNRLAPKLVSILREA